MTFYDPDDEWNSDDPDTVVKVNGFDGEIRRVDDDTDENDHDDHYDAIEEQHTEPHAEPHTESADTDAGGAVEADVVYAPPAVIPERRRYRLPSQMSQISSIYTVQMRQYAKSPKSFLLLLLILPIFLIPFALVHFLDADEAFFAELEITFVLNLLPYMMVLIPALFAGRILSSEFRNRTAYMVFPLPISRTAFYIGKFMAALTLSFGLILMGFGAAIITADMYGIYVPEDMLTSIALTLCAVFAIASMAYMLSTFFKKGSVGVMFIIMIVVPIILSVGWVILLEYMIGEAYISAEFADSMSKVLMLLPIFAYAAVMVHMGMDVGSLTTYTMNFDPGFVNVLLFEPFDFALASVVAGILFLVIGLIRIKRKEL